MNYLELPNNAFRLKLSATLLSQLLVVGVKSDEFIEFVAAQFQNIIACKPNCRIHTAPDKPVWVLRGYYPNTPVFFKLTVVKAVGFQQARGKEDFLYFVRATELKVKAKKRWRETLNISYDEIIIMSNDIMKNISEGMENTILGAAHETKNFIKDEITKPKCMSPKGMKLFRYKKPSSRKKL